VQAPLLRGVEPHARQQVELLVGRNAFANRPQQIIRDFSDSFLTWLKRGDWCHDAAGAATVTGFDDGQQTHVELSYDDSWINDIVLSDSPARGKFVLCPLIRRCRGIHTRRCMPRRQFASASILGGASDCFFGWGGADTGINSTMTGVSRDGIFPGQAS
jgi:hypothetical protein